jgi:hypothetical protein
MIFYHFYFGQDILSACSIEVCSQHVRNSDLGSFFMGQRAQELSQVTFTATDLVVP